MGGEDGEGTGGDYGVDGGEVWVVVGELEGDGGEDVCAVGD